MVLLYEGQDDAGKRYLDQATIGEVFCLSLQMTNARIALYRRRHRIEDVLVRNRGNHVLTQPVVNKIHQQILDDPFVSASSIRSRLVTDGLIGTEDDVTLTSIYRAVILLEIMESEVVCESSSAKRAQTWVHAYAA